MNLPTGFLDELKTRTSLALVAGRKVMWDQRKSNQGKGDMWASCPFHQENTASFHVDDRKGVYYCFGCHAKGDAISFVQESENVGFSEAVEILAREAGMQIPARDPLARQKSDRRAQLAAVMEEAVRWYRLQLKKAANTGARDYLERRGLGEELQERFEIGYAPDSRQALFAQLSGRGVAAQLLVDAGLVARPDEPGPARGESAGGGVYDRFRGRIIFPIRDARGRCVGLGGRALSPHARAKYLNSPQTEIFDKGRNLYNHAPAREAAGHGQTLVVAEGYMDVIALVGAGFGATVAPLGTAITADQLRLLWRIAPEPVIALDGDKAGLAAAMRLIDLALPLLEAGRGVRFALLPEGMDPDDVIREHGAEAMLALVETALPMARLLWRRETEGRVFDSPERRAGLDKVLHALLRRIADASIRVHYREEFRRLRADLFRDPARAGRGRGNWHKGSNWHKGGDTTPAPAAETRSSRLAGGGAGDAGEDLQEAAILATILTHQGLLARFESDLEQLEFRNPGHAAISATILRCADAPDLRAVVAAAVGAELVEKLFESPHVRVTPAIRKPDDHEGAVATLAEQMAKLSAQRGATRELAEAEQEIGGVVGEGLTWRIAKANEARERARRIGFESEAAEFEIAPNGARIDRHERESARKLFDAIAHGARKDGR